MKTFARIYEGAVVELITPGLNLNETQYALEECFPEEIVAQCVDVTDLTPRPDQRWLYDGAGFTPAPDLVPTDADILASNSSTLYVLQAKASQIMMPLLISLQLGDASEVEIAEAKLWQAYSRALKLVDITVAAPTWPDAPE
jgi:hypothetical protein